MRYTPTKFMILTWLGCFAAFYVLPFRLVSRDFSIYGMAVLWLFILAFCISATITTRNISQHLPDPNYTVDFYLADILLISAACTTIIAVGIELRGKVISDLAAAYVERSARASAVLAGDSMGGSIWFQIGFLTYGASFIYLVREIAFERKLRFLRIGTFGVLPIFMASMALGGRGTILYGLIIAALAYRMRQLSGAGPTRKKQGDSASGQTVFLRIGLIVLSLVAMMYFVQVFFVRSEFAGGPENAFIVARDGWGVSFDGPGGEFLRETFGERATYLIFVFSWYLVQGLVMANNLFTQYDGGMLFGVYGLDIATAIARRINGEFVSRGFAVLLGLNTYGFLPSAFGSLYVDFKFFGLLLTAFWGWACAVVYNSSRRNLDRRWLLLVPFVSLGIFFSLINTPLGFSNGLVTHFWLLLAFKTARMRRIASTNYLVHPRTMTR